MGMMFWLMIYLACNVEVQAETATNCSITCAAPSGNEPACNSITGNCLYGCKDGYTGIQCQLPCGSNCTRCSVASDHTTTCSTCGPGYFRTAGECTECPSICTEDPDGREPKCYEHNGDCRIGCVGNKKYRPKCNKYCSPFCVDKICDITGYCTYGCVNTGVYGDDCMKYCSDGCVRKQCHRSGECIHGCNSGYYSKTCERCSHNCSTLPAPFTIHDCNVTNGHCHGCNRKTIWGPFCQYECPFSCVGLECDQINGFCTLGCKNEWLEECSIVCSPNCLNGTCFQNNVTCIHGCANKWYGAKCDMECEGECIGEMCNRDTGFCDEGCVDGWYGQKCDCKCSINCLNKTCTINGTCTHGCLQGFSGNACNIFDGARTCSKTCATPASNMTACNSSTGDCLYECKDGYTGPQCQYPCGSNCTRCSLASNAAADTVCYQCDVTTYLDYGMCKPCGVSCRLSPDNSAHACGDDGACLLGCTDGFGGKGCNISCGIHRCLQCTIDSADRSLDLCYECAPDAFLSDGGKMCPVCKYSCLPDPNGRQPTCQRYDGFCTYGCEGGNKCGRLCQNGCGGLCVNKQCDRTTCCCTEGCFLEGYTGCKCNEKCQDSCVDGLCYQNGTCKLGCRPNFWDYNCKPCSSACKDDGNNLTSVCNPTNGICNDGCIDNTTWGLTCQPCPDKCMHGECNTRNGICDEGCAHNATWGNTCNIKCPENCKHGQCNHNTGFCIEGCVNNSTWGTTCAAKCPYNCMNDQCNSNDGFCIDGCVSNILWGPTCEQKCPENCKHGQCNERTGFCIDGCVDNTVWGTMCIKCPNNCLHGQCNSQNGSCSDGCLYNAIWGPTCDNICSDSCMHGECNSYSGHCTAGCVNNATWGPTCGTVCPDGCKYGQCNFSNGFCNDGCVNNFTCGITCEMKCLEYGTHDIMEHQQGEQYQRGAVIGSLVTAGVLSLVILVVVGLILRRYQLSLRSVQTSTTQIAPTSQTHTGAAGGYDDLSVERNPSAYEMIQR